ncbi:hypothetical protein EDB85DRAFT_1899638 [Lactarius pseudohatsudake]|nr:hypothetical protein EDB85DRAFT_1899638 [Lactarius pseudohatsudake]
MCPPFRSCAAPPPGLRSALPRLARTPFARLLRSPLALVPRSVYPLACAPLLWARRETREGWGTARRGLGWAHRPSYPWGYAGVAGCIKARGGGGRADPPPCVRGRLAGVARAEEDWAVRAVPPLARVGGAGRAICPLAYAGRAGRGLGWRGPRGGGGAPSLLLLCGRGGVRARKCSRGREKRITKDAGKKNDISERESESLYTACIWLDSAVQGHFFLCNLVEKWLSYSLNKFGAHSTEIDVTV